MSICTKTFLAGLIGVHPSELSEDTVKILVNIGRAMHWSESFHDVAKKLSEDYEKEANNWAGFYRC